MRTITTTIKYIYNDNLLKYLAGKDDMSDEELLSFARQTMMDDLLDLNDPFMINIIEAKFEETL